MKLRYLKLVCFSPTGTTKAIIESIGRGIDQPHVELIDLTKPSARKQKLRITESDLLVVAVPVYVGRVPVVAAQWLNRIEAHKTPVVGVAVYGNRDYDDTLLELMDIVKQRGCIPIAGAAFIGEHSFSSPETPIAVGRPDAGDLQQAQRLGRNIFEKLKALSTTDNLTDIGVPGTYPYRGPTRTWVVDFIEVNDTCTNCGLCSEKCPMAAIDAHHSSRIDREKCILCCACIKRCPQKARSVKPGPVKDAAIRIGDNFRQRKEPVFFL